MIPLEEKIARTQRLLQRLEEDVPYMQARLAVLTPESRASASAFAENIRRHAETELERLLSQRSSPKAKRAAAG